MKTNKKLTLDKIKVARVSGLNEIKGGQMNPTTLIPVHTQINKCTFITKTIPISM
ncbi:hypothetical protein [Aquimarina sp. AU474]|uniref:hypothetical protein n=1 Tax=Aquimarina sp. AU474 TaxID=2108529 RepID=UPI00135B193A|nr:hypothetical protein [Aquimarina sp. AU474]